MNDDKLQKARKSLNRDSIIGLGEDSFRKNYYPELQEKIHTLEKINARNQAIISTIPDLMLLCDDHGNMTPFAYATKEDEVLMQSFLEDEKMAAFLRETALSLRESHQFLVEEIDFFTNDHAYFFEARFHRSEKNETLIIVRNVTRQKVMLLKLKDMAERDTLTGLYNRQMFELYLREKRELYIECLAVISIDINGLKFINDTLGHQMGDQVLVWSSERINQIFETYGTVYRTGGDEFTVIIEGLLEAEIEQLLSQLSTSIELPSVSEGIGPISLSYGYGYHTTGLMNIDYLFQTADNNMLQSKLLKKDSNRGTFVKTFLKALEAKDYISQGHADRMEELALLIGEKLGLHSDQIDRIILLTKFHDIGKIGIPDSILKKPAKLTPDEWEVMRSHTTIGERIALESIEIRDIAPLILHHHERWDGKGYPSQLKGTDIPIEDRILGIVDSFDAMTNDRPYHQAMPIDEAVAEIIRCSGGQFDPTIVQTFLQVYMNML